jgi:hypothetical protein
VTLLKLFLADLWQLGGLYRVGSLIGLAIVLMVVSFAYQRFFGFPAVACRRDRGVGNAGGPNHPAPIQRPHETISPWVRFLPPPGSAAFHGARCPPQCVSIGGSSRRWPCARQAR